jgi:hypothetical protein
MQVPLNQGCDGSAPGVHRLHHVQVGIENLRIGAVIHPEPVFTRSHPQPGRPACRHGLHDGSNHLVGHVFVPIMIDVKGSVWPVVVVTGTDDDFQFPANSRWQPGGCLVPHDVGIHPEHHV